MGNNPSNSNHQQLERGGGVGKFGDVHARRSLRSPRKMDRLRRSFRDSFRRRKDRVPESSKPHQWQEDESAVRQGACAFAVKYLGCVEVFESRGMQVCEEALKLLRASRRRTVRAMLHVSGDGLRVVEDDTKGLIVDQTIEKVSFCAPDRNHERGFSYICRDGTTRRWMCHGFLAMRESGERLSHAVGCAFAVCLEKKQRRDKECGVTMTFDAKNSTFTRSGSFRQPSLTESMEQQQQQQNQRGGGVVNIGGRGDDMPKMSNSSSIVNPFAIERPHATPSMLERQNSFRGFAQLGQNSPFKRQMSLRVQDLPSHAERLSLYKHAQQQAAAAAAQQQKSVSPIPELTGDSVTALCQQLSEGLSQLTHSGSDDFNFNSQSSVNQNNVSVTLTSTTITNTFNNVMLPSPTAPVVVANVTPLSLNTSGSDHSPAKSAVSPNTSLVSNTSLPRPEQWLTNIVGSSSPNTSTTSSTASSSLLNRRLQLSAHSRAMSLDSSSMTESYGRPAGGGNAATDPFDAEWVAPTVRQDPATNPFLSNATQPQAFQVQL